MPQNLQIIFEGFFYVSFLKKMN